MNIGDRMKKYERESLSESYIPAYKPYIIRLDGNCFSKFTNSFKKPFDIIFFKAMLNTCNDLIIKFNAVTGYTHSDEITIIFAKECTKSEFETDSEKYNHLFNGRVNKLLSLTAGYCSVRFNHHLHLLLQKADDKYYVKNLDKLLSNSSIFDSRLLLFPDDKDEDEIVNHMIWRSVHDCYRNCISTYAYNYFGKKAIFKKNCGQLCEMLKEKGIDVEDIPFYFRHGIYIKRELKNIVTKFFDKRTREITEVETIRSRSVFFTTKINFTSLFRDLMINKYMLKDLDELDLVTRVEI